ncbi:sulfatase [Oceanicoccus sp. KOV_DT_Chl]|uniref:sulfatase family protein n=1 Tax=Oceanicoccus sp. KOV_DT_Chl TaxID=1904639 RepID=UPI001356A80F|nr:sulfatase [Oceanicoccus sp. KOV_DT_Chl]
MIRQSRTSYFLPRIVRVSIGCLLAVLPVMASAVVGDEEQLVAKAPNIIVILADDLGYGDISSFGAKTIATPRIDQLAEDGLRMTQFYAAAPVCTPSRAGLMTGRYAARMGMSHVFMADAPDGMPLSEITIAEQLKQAGYYTGMVGKWHLGHQDRYMPWNQGFDEFYGVPFSNDMANFFFYENQKIIYEPIDQRYLTRRYTEKAVDYIERHADVPFFLYLAHSMPHVPLYVSPEFEGKSAGGLYGDVVQELDWSTGEVVDKLRQLGLLENTLIVFSSDNGPWLAMGDHGGSSGSLRDGKGSTFEGGQRVPTVIHWPAQINGGRVESSITSLMDLMPTFSALANVPLPADRTIDGEDITAILTGDGVATERQFFYNSAAAPEIVAYREGNWKLKLARSGYPKILEPIIKFDRYSHELMLFNLETDPSEKNNIAAEYPERVTRMQQAIADLEKNIAAAEPRELYMRATSSDKKGYGPLFIKGGLLVLAVVLLALALLYGLYRLIKIAIYRGDK